VYREVMTVADARTTSAAAPCCQDRLHLHLLFCLLSVDVAQCSIESGKQEKRPLVDGVEQEGGAEPSELRVR
jgi:hypothetical protein